MLKKHLKKNEYQALVEFKEKLSQKLAGEVLELKLFGSKVRGDSHKESDIDVLVVLKRKTKKNEDFILELTTDLLLKYGILISPITFSKKEFLIHKKLPSIFLQIVEREEIPL